MTFSIKRIGKYIRWLKTTNNKFKNDCKISKEYAEICRRLSWAMLLKKPKKEQDKIATEKNEWILKYISDRIPEALNKYKNYPVPENLNEPQKKIKVWSMFWQGEDDAPELFKVCIDSARRHTGHDVIVLSEENYKEYFDIPEYMINKYHEGKMRVQHICDFMVVSILATQGGYFTGATVWNSQDISEDILRAPFYSPAAKKDDPFFMSGCRWTGYLMAGNKEFPMFQFAVDALKEYWKNCDLAVDYLMLDYVFELACRTIPCINDVINNLPDNNLLRNELIGILSEPYDKEAFMRYTEGDTFLYKLSWKFGKKDKVTADGRETIYGHMVKECADRI